MKPQNRPVIERRGPGAPRQPMKPRAWNHQDELKAGVGRDVTLALLDGTTRRGKLVAADQFTIKAAIGNQSALTFFKGNLLGYCLED
ncbi:hypothetical protein [Methylobacterium oryzae]|uniref:hypothetical protein n=1 Tax=Methylobacterium oryzae TaxID=334852 RepID=UPI001F332925|nr:hypothetical protein [Methylobacterium oryzae]UIN38308.1 hypothetical protein LXM90_31225 [Methylobacterium oryzae]